MECPLCSGSWGFSPHGDRETIRPVGILSLMEKTDTNTDVTWKPQKLQDPIRAEKLGMGILGRVRARGTQKILREQNLRNIH